MKTNLYSKNKNRTSEKQISVSANAFAGQNAGKLRDHYRIGKILGTGEFGEVRVAVHRETGSNRAVKIMRKNNMNDSETEKMFQEITVLSDLDHPNVIKFFEFFEDERKYYMVTEICNGGELFDQIVKNTKFNEADAAVIIKHVMSSVNYLHKNEVMHRDLKAENVLLENNMEYDQIKIIDFGSSTKFEDYEYSKFDENIGNSYYKAPEVISGNYGPKCDIWSVGVMAYILLTGLPPFNGVNEAEINKKVKTGKISFTNSVWKNISDDAKDFITSVLVKDANRRPTAQKALQHSWIKKAEQKQRDDIDEDQAMATLNNLGSFASSSKFKQATYAFIASQLLTKNEKEHIDKVFRAMDLNGDGKLSRDEIRAGYSEYFGRVIKESELDKIFEKCDADGSGGIDYSEFVVATMNEKKILSNNKLKQAFRMFDKDDGGSISSEEVRQVLSFGGHLEEKVIKKIIKKIDKDGNGEIDFDEFVKLMHSNIA